MKEIINNPWNFSFFEENNQLFLIIVCGNVGIFELKIKLTKKECELYQTTGVTYIENLVKDIQNSPSKYIKRNLN
ncbi:hypothetical protein EMA8858_01365 [Emticicia aquatica]|uniref:Uncharacterized protein n=1 Tax=Emticicia aquatica TaxID=1681835 RepID=A0ABN8EQR8_9BACT|nr:hypothetical protein [Emticicia aquatica]CAH0995245.1 hypothetical protein EMA8858_01365 [Emticicia aquatica]